MASSPAHLCKRVLHIPQVITPHVHIFHPEKHVKALRYACANTNTLQEIRPSAALLLLTRVHCPRGDTRHAHPPPSS
jgi:hypothetical protein